MIAEPSVPPQPPACIACKHFIPDQAGIHICAHSPFEFNPVTGERDRRSCQREREPQAGRCCPEGTFFERA